MDGHTAEYAAAVSLYVPVLRERMHCLYNCIDATRLKHLLASNAAVLNDQVQHVASPMLEVMGSRSRTHRCDRRLDSACTKKTLTSPCTVLC